MYLSIEFKTEFFVVSLTSVNFGINLLFKPTFTQYHKIDYIEPLDRKHIIDKSL